MLWQGSILMLVEELVSGELDLKVDEAARVCAEWNLRAIGLDDSGTETEPRA